ncbi:MAG: hypothetical protein U0736_16465 [Gemmataceae bacterium]
MLLAHWAWPLSIRAGLRLLHRTAGGWPMLALVLAAIGVAWSLAQVTWVVIAELVPNRIRAPPLPVAVVALWLACRLF